MKLINGDTYDIQLTTNELQEHFRNPYNYTKEIMEEWDILPYNHFIQPGDTLLDIGANIGLFALHAAPYFKKIICVEPTPSHMKLQRELLKPFVYVQHEQSALNNYTGKARFRNEPINTTMNTLRDAPDSYEVNCITLKDLCEKYGLNKVDFCKIDIEGSEFQALTIERIAEVKDVIRRFFVELHPRTEASQNEMASRFEQAGYKADKVDFNGSVYCYL